MLGQEFGHFRLLIPPASAGGSFTLTYTSTFFGCQSHQPSAGGSFTLTYTLDIFRLSIPPASAGGSFTLTYQGRSRIPNPTNFSVGGSFTPTLSCEDSHILVRFAETEHRRTSEQRPVRSADRIPLHACQETRETLP
jgi:hypothetical protein